MLRSDLCDYNNNAYIVVKDVAVNITLTRAANINFISARNQFLAFKNNTPFTNCISKINNILTVNAEDLDM